MAEQNNNFELLAERTKTAAKRGIELSTSMNDPKSCDEFINRVKEIRALPLHNANRFIIVALAPIHLKWCQDTQQHKSLIYQKG